MSEIGNKTILRALADAIQSLDPRSFPSVLNTDDVKVVLPIQVGSYQEFTVQTSTSLLGDAATTSYTLFRVGGIGANGVGVDGQMNCGGGSLDGGGGAETFDLPDAELYDYRVLAAHFSITYDAAALAADVGAGIQPMWLMARELSPWSAGPFFIAPTNVGDGKTVDADETIYTFSIFGRAAGFDSPSTWPGWVPGVIGNQLGLQLIHRASPGGAKTAWPAAGSTTFLSRVYGVRFPKGRLAI